MLAHLPGTNPRQSATVQASAGSGKTWLLVSRLMRLLLDGAEPGDILALTFTRKAAAEMQERLRARLRELALCSETELDTALQNLGVKPDQDSRSRARHAYERVLKAPFPLRTSTFHSFCQDLLKQFTFEAALPTGFDLLEDSDEVEEIAWQTLLQQITAGDAAQQKTLTRYLHNIGSLDSAEKALKGFLSHRLDWWAYVDSCHSKGTEPHQELQPIFLPHDCESDIYSEFWQAINIDELEFYAGILDVWGTATGLKTRTALLKVIQQLRNEQNSDHARDTRLFNELKIIILTQENSLRSYQRSEKTIAKKAAAQQLNADDFFALHARLGNHILDALAALNRYKNYQINADWMTLGQQLIDNFQHIKRERGLLDFADLEWHTVKLLNNPNLGEWIQYKLDQRLQHILIDEFQDTSPTQWTMLRPVIETILAEESDRSLFIVGDNKQSIYGFRRADPQLLRNAIDWVTAHTEYLPRPAEKVILAKSWRSSSVIMQTVNAIFANALPDFPLHDTNLKTSPGQVTLLPIADIDDQIDNLADNKVETEATSALRNPLTTPRQDNDDTRALEEGRQIATEIQRLIATDTPVIDHKGETRALEYNDVLILLRKRTNVGPIEQALRAANIPFIGADRDSFASSIEIQDFQALLRVLHSPWDNMACAQILRSPLFDWDDQKLIHLAMTAKQNKQPWSLTLLNANDDANNKLFATNNAPQLLSKWLALSKVLPTHDLLDRIFHDSQALPRYRAAFPKALHARVEANFKRLLQLALETDGGRYPSLRRFNEKIARTTAALPAASGCVKIMTIHAAKGLEAPAVFLANSATTSEPHKAWQTLVNWPAGSAEPMHMLLRTSQSKQDEITSKLSEIQDEADNREQLNLLYVALTRAKHYLYISGFKSKRDNKNITSWYDRCKDSLTDMAADDSLVKNTLDDGSLTLSYRSNDVLDSLRLQQSTQADTQPDSHSGVEQHDSRPSWLMDIHDLSHARLATATLEQNEEQTIEQALEQSITPSAEPALAQQQNVDDTIELDGTHDSRLRGIAIHALLEKLTPTTHTRELEVTHSATQESALAYAYAMTGLLSTDPRWADWFKEANSLIRAPACYNLLTWQPNCVNAWNELPVFASTAVNHRVNKTVYGIIDRVVDDGSCIHCIDYKTQRQGASPELIAHYEKQMSAYAFALKNIFINRDIKSYLLFTAAGEFVELPSSNKTAPAHQQSLPL